MARDPIIEEHEALADRALDSALDGMQHFADELIWLRARDAHLDAGCDTWEQYLNQRWGQRLRLHRDQRQVLAQALIAITGSPSQAGDVMGVSRSQASRLAAGKTGNEAKQGQGVRSTHTPEEVEGRVARVSAGLAAIPQVYDDLRSLVGHKDPAWLAEQADRLATLQQQVLDALENPGA